MSDASSHPPVAGARPLFPEDQLPDVLKEIGDVLRGGRLILGPKTKLLEEAWAKRVGTKHAVAVSSCTAALEIAYRHACVQGREVVVPTNTFVATANAAVAAGGRVVFADMDPDDYSADADDVARRVTEETAAVVVVHIAGFLNKGLEALRHLCRERKIRLIEDCAHAHGASVDGREAGSLGDVGCFSLYPTKILTCGVGGVLTTDDDDLATFARSLRHHGQGESLESIVNAGNDWMMDEVRAVLARAQLDKLDEFLAARRRVAAVYDERLASEGRVTLPKLAGGTQPAYYKYPVVLREGIHRDAVRSRMLERYRIEIGALYSPPCHLMPVFRSSLGTGPGQLPNAERLLPQQLCLPMHAALSVEDAHRCVDAFLETLTDLE